MYQHASGNQRYCQHASDCACLYIQDKYTECSSDVAVAVMSGKALWPLSIPHNSYVLLMRAGALRKRPEVVSLIAETACYNDCLKFHTEVSMLGIMTLSLCR